MFFQVTLAFAEGSEACGSAGQGRRRKSRSPYAKRLSAGEGIKKVAKALGVGLSAPGTQPPLPLGDGEYVPQAAPLERGPTGVIPGSQYQSQRQQRRYSPWVPSATLCPLWRGAGNGEAALRLGIQICW
jgi:hypothetical protein